MGQRTNALPSAEVKLFEVSNRAEAMMENRMAHALNSEVFRAPLFVVAQVKRRRASLYLNRSPLFNDLSRFECFRRGHHNDSTSSCAARDAWTSLGFFPDVFSDGSVLTWLISEQW